MKFLRRATIALVTSVLAIGGVTMMASPADAKDTNWPSYRADTNWPS